MAKLKTQIGECVAEQCTEQKYAYNLCKKHNQRRYKTGRIDLGPRVAWNKSIIKICVMDNCENKHVSRGFCSKHYRAFNAWLDKDRRIEMRSQQKPVNDKEGYVLLYMPDHPNCAVTGGYAEHRLIMEKMIGRYLVKGENVHHKNGVKNDNRPENLELWSSRQPKGQRIEDKVEYAMDILKLYAPNLLKDVN